MFLVEILSTDTELTPQMRILKNNHWQSGYIYMIVVEGIDLIRLLNVWAGHYDPDQVIQHCILIYYASSC